MCYTVGPKPFVKLNFNIYKSTFCSFIEFSSRNGNGYLPRLKVRKITSEMGSLYTSGNNGKLLQNKFGPIALFRLGSGPFIYYIRRSTYYLSM